MNCTSFAKPFSSINLQVPFGHRNDLPQTALRLTPRCPDLFEVHHGFQGLPSLLDFIILVGSQGKTYTHMPSILYGRSGTLFLFIPLNSDMSRTLEELKLKNESDFINKQKTF
jgi:hypothetical protein